MSLYSYFAEASKRSVLPNPNGSLSASVSPTAVAVKSVMRERASGEGVTLSSNLHEQQAAIRKYDTAIQHFSKQLGVIFSSALGILANELVLIGQPYGH